jgi:hypothetical protein
MAFIPILLVAALVYFLFIRPIQRRSSATGQGFIASISSTYFIVLGLVAIGYGVAWRFASNDPGMLRMSGIDSQSAHSSLDALKLPSHLPTRFKATSTLAITPKCEAIEDDDKNIPQVHITMGQLVKRNCV